MLQVSEATGLLSGFSWPYGTLTFGFPESLGDYPAGYDRSVISGQSALPEGARVAVREAVLQFNASLALTLSETDPALDWPDIAVSKFDGFTVAQTYLPSGDGYLSGDVVANTDLSFLDILKVPAASLPGEYAFAVMLHELGHALGLKHPHDLAATGSVRMPTALDGLEHTVMSYRSYVGDLTTGGYDVRVGHYPQSLMVLDIAALQALYGANYATAAGETVYRFDAATAEVVRDGVSLGRPATAVVFRTLWDGGGADVIDLSDQTQAVWVDLTPGGGVDLDWGGTAWRAELSGGVLAPRHLWFSLLEGNDPRGSFEHATGGAGADWLGGNALANRLIGGAGNDTLNGGSGNDALYGGAGADVMDGGDGSDIYVVDATDRIQDTGDAGYDKAQVRSATGTTLVLAADAGLERVNGNLGDDILDAGQSVAGIVLFGNEGADVLTGGAGDDVLIGGNGADTLIGGAGDDLLLGNGGDDVLTGGAGDDVFLIGGSGDCVSDGGIGQDRALISVSSGLSIAVGDWRGVERIGGYLGDDVIDATGMMTALTIAGSAGSDHLIGGAGDDTLFGGTGADRLTGAAGADALIGADGDDVLDGGAGDDFYFGGAGADRFVWSDGFGHDVVRDFEPGRDVIDLTAVTGVAALSDLILAQEATHTVIRLVSGDPDAITLADFSLSDLQPDDLLFA